jgi:sugar lactone lactonase YvrE
LRPFTFLLAGTMIGLTLTGVRAFAQSVYTPYTFKTIGGVAGGAGSADGMGNSARFAEPWDVAVDNAGNVYVADTGNNAIRKVTSAGVVTTLAGLADSKGHVDGKGSAARFNSPFGVAVDNAGNVYVADTFNETIRKVTPAGVVTTLAGSALNMGSEDGRGSEARFNNPKAIAVDRAGNIYVADSADDTIRKVTPEGVVTTLAGLADVSGTRDGKAGAARFGNMFGGPSGVAVDGAGNVYVADTGNQTIRKVTPTGVVTTLAGVAGSEGTNDGVGTLARFDDPEGVAVDISGNVYVADFRNHTIRKVTPSGVVTTLAGLAGSLGCIDGKGSAARFGAVPSFGPSGVAVGTDGNIFVADTGNHTIRKVTPDGVVTTLAGLATGHGSAPKFHDPTGVAVDHAGNIYVADTGNQIIRKMTPAGAVTILAGAGQRGSMDGAGNEAQFTDPFAVAVDNNGNVYVADTGNNVIRKVTSAGVVTTLAGLAGKSGSTDGTGSTARFGSRDGGPIGLAVDDAGNVYVADSQNHTIRKVTAAGAVTTMAGNASIMSVMGLPAGGSTDGTGSEARFNYPGGVAVDKAGNVYVADTLNHTVRKITPAGVVSTLAGLAGSVGSADGTGTAARFWGPDSVSVDGRGNIYVADTGNRTIRRITPAGVVTTLAGQVGSNGNADGTGSMARFGYPTSVAADNAGNVYVVNNGNSTVLKGSPAVTTP